MKKPGKKHPWKHRNKKTQNGFDILTDTDDMGNLKNSKSKCRIPRSFDDDLMSCDVQKVINDIEDSKKERQQKEISNKMNIIHNRIKKVLSDAGLGSNLDFNSSCQYNQLVSGSPIAAFDAKEARRQIREQQSMLATIAHFYLASVEKRKTLEDIYEFFSSFSDMDEGLISDVQMDARKQDIMQNHHQLLDALEMTWEITAQLTSIGETIINKAKNIEKELNSKRASLPLPKKAIGTIIQNPIDDESLLSDSDCMDKALNDVRKVMEGCVKRITSIQGKSMARSGIKQFKFIVLAIQRMSADLTETKNNVVDLREHIELEKRDEDAKAVAVAQYDVDLNEMTIRLEMVGEENETLRQLIESKDVEIKNQTEELNILRLQIENIAERSQPHDTVTPLTSPLDAKQEPRPLSATAQLVNSVTDLINKNPVVIALREELMDLQEKSCKQDDDNVKKQRQIHEEQEKYQRLEANFEKLESESEHKAKTHQNMTNDNDKSRIDSIEKEKSTLEKEIHAIKKNKELSSLKTSRSSVVGDHYTEMMESVKKVQTAPLTTVEDNMKKFSQRLKKEHQLELDRMKDHVGKDKIRSETVLRKLENSHKEHLSSVYKESLYILRSVNRFKESITAILKQQNHPTAAAELRQLPNLPAEENAGIDPGTVLSQLSGKAVDLLVNIEYRLSEALANKQLQIKDSAIKSSFAAKELEMYIEMVQKSKQKCQVMADKLKVTREKLYSCEEALREIRHIENSRYQREKARYTLLRQQFQGLQKDMHHVISEYTKLVHKEDTQQETLKKKRQLQHLIDEQTLVITQLRVEINKKRAKTERIFCLSIKDQKKNLQILADSYNHNKISKQIYQMTTDLIEEMTHLPIVRLKQLFGHYIAVHKLAAARDQVEKFMRSKVLSKKKTHHLKVYLALLDVKLGQESQDWSQQRNKHENEKKELLSKSELLLQDFLIDSEMPFISHTHVQHLRDVTHDVTTTQQQYGIGYSDLTSIKYKIYHGNEEPIGLVGQGIGTQQHDEEMWRIPTGYSRTCSPSREVPHIQLLDIQSRLLAAQRVIEKDVLKMTRVEPCDYSYQRVMTLAEAVHWDHLNAAAVVLPNVYNSSIIKPGGH